MQKPKAQIFGLYSSASLHVSKTLFESHSNLSSLVNSTSSHPLSVVKLCNQEEKTTEEYRIPQNKSKETDRKKGKVSTGSILPLSTQGKGGGQYPQYFLAFPNLFPNWNAKSFPFSQESQFGGLLPKWAHFRTFINLYSVYIYIERHGRNHLNYLNS